MYNLIGQTAIIYFINRSYNKYIFILLKSDPFEVAGRDPKIVFFLTSNWCFLKVTLKKLDIVSYNKYQTHICFSRYISSNIMSIWENTM